MDKKNKKIQYRDDDDQDNENDTDDTEIKEADMIGRPDGDYGFDAEGDVIAAALAESPVSPDVGWEFHPMIVSGWLTVFATINCIPIWPPLFDRTYVEYCHNYEGGLPLWANDYIIYFEWDYFCDNVDSFKVAVPYYDGDFWRLHPLVEWMQNNMPPSGLSLPSLGDSTGAIQNVHVIVNPIEWLNRTKQMKDEYTIVDGECPDLPGYLIGTTPIVFDSLAGPLDNPFSTTPLTGTLIHDASLTFHHIERYTCGDADASGGVDIDDVVHLINFIFASGPEPIPYESGDADCSGGVDIDDVVYLIAYIFSAGDPPCDPDGDGEPNC
jgi:hypothetical protein